MAAKRSKSRPATRLDPVALCERRPDTPNVWALEREPRGRGKRSLAVADEDTRSTVQNIIDAVDDHKMLREARIVVLTSRGHVADADGHLLGGKAGRSSLGLDVLAAGADFVIALNADVIDQASPLGRCALIDHELSHCAATIAGRHVGPRQLARFVAGLGKRHIETCDDITDKKGRPLVRYWKTDSEGRLVWRIRKHDVEGFVDVMGRWGAWHEEARRLTDVLEPTLGKAAG